jgi:hypothetical protein
MNQSLALLTPDQVSNILGVKKHTLAVWRSYGRYQLSFVKAGRLVRYRSSDVDYSSKGRVYVNLHIGVFGMNLHSKIKNLYPCACKVLKNVIIFLKIHPVRLPLKQRCHDRDL